MNSDLDLIVTFLTTRGNEKVYAIHIEDGLNIPELKNWAVTDGEDTFKYLKAKLGTKAAIFIGIYRIEKIDMITSIPENNEIPKTVEAPSLTVDKAITNEAVIYGEWKGGVGCINCRFISMKMVCPRCGESTTNLSYRVGYVWRTYKIPILSNITSIFDVPYKEKFKIQFRHEVKNDN